MLLVRAEASGLLWAKCPFHALFLHNYLHCKINRYFEEFGVYFDTEGMLEVDYSPKVIPCIGSREIIRQIRNWPTPMYFIATIL